MSTKKSAVAKAVAELRTAYDETQQAFSNRLGLALATVARWETGERYPSPRYLKELWHLSAEKKQLALVKTFADAFALRAGYALSVGAAGFVIRRLISDIRHNTLQLLDEQLGPEARVRIGTVLKACADLDDAVREFEGEPPFRALTVKDKRK